MVDCFNPTICATEETEMDSKQAMANRLNSPKAIEQIAGVVSVQGKEFRSKIVLLGKRTSGMYGRCICWRKLKLWLLEHELAVENICNSMQPRQ